MFPHATNYSDVLDLSQAFYFKYYLMWDRDGDEEKGTVPSNAFYLHSDCSLQGSGEHCSLPRYEENLGTTEL